MSLAVSLPVIGLDQFLRTPAAIYAAQPATQAEHWITDSLMAVPCFAIGAWAADLIAGRAKIGATTNLHLFKRSLVIAVFSSLALLPAFFVVNKTANPIRLQPLVFPQAHDSGDVYSVPSGVIVALVCVCLVPAALWAGRVFARVITSAWPATARTALLRAAVPAVLAALVPVLAWLMFQAAGHAYASQVYYARAPTAVVRRARPAQLPAAASRPSVAPSLTAAPDALVSQAAHALQDGLAGQAAGIPVSAVMAAALPRARNPRYRGKHTVRPYLAV